MNSTTWGSSFIESAREGAKKLLSQCLNLNTNDVLALFLDETTAEPAYLVCEVARELGLEVRMREVSTTEQSKFSANQGLSLEDKEALECARGIITCLSNHVPGTAYRVELLRVGAAGGKRFGHMPGCNMSVLAHAINIDYSLATERCDNLALALTLGQMVRLRTYVLDAEGNPQQSFDLNFEVGGMIRSPITSTGIIPLGTWGNLPGGETFIAPIENTAQGTFVLNGAFKNFVINPQDYLLLHFSKGRLQDVEGTPDVRTQFEEILSFAKSHGDTYYNSLAELGIGVNPGIQELTGNALFDEKCHGTAHIAIGDNSRYGGLYSSRIHEDLITRAPSLWIDDKPILSYGKDVLVQEEWRESLYSYPAPLQPIDPNLILTRTSIHADKGSDGRLRVRREVASGRVCNYTVAEAETSRIIADIYTDHIPRLPQQVKADELFRTVEQRLGLSTDNATKAIRILKRHGLITFRDSK